MRKLSYNYDYDYDYGGSADDGDANNKNKKQECYQHVHSTPMRSRENNTAAALDAN